MAGGLLFGTPIGTLLVIFSATLGASLIFLAVRMALVDLINATTLKWVKILKHGFQANAFNYLLFLRLIPLFPFWIINIVPALLNIRLKTYVFATLIGITPASAVYVSLGNGLKNILTLTLEDEPKLNIIFIPEIILPIILLAFLAIVPVLYKKFWNK